MTAADEGSMVTEEPRHRCRIQCLCVVCAMSLEIPAGVPLGARLQGYPAAAVTTWGLAGHINGGVCFENAEYGTADVGSGPIEINVCDEVRLCLHRRHAGSRVLVLQQLLSTIRTRRLEKFRCRTGARSQRIRMDAANRDVQRHVSGIGYEERGTKGGDVKSERRGFRGGKGSKQKKRSTINTSMRVKMEESDRNYQRGWLESEGRWEG